MKIPAASSIILAPTAPFRVMNHLPRRFLAISFALMLSSPSLKAQEEIVGGTDVAPGVYPWMVTLIRRGSDPLLQRHFCGGSLIHRDWVVTAAHCVDDLTKPDELEVWANLTDLENPGEAVGRKVRAIFIHPSYNSNSLYGDIALLLLDTPIDSVAPIAYSKSSSDVAAGTAARVLGWGGTKNEATSPRLKYADISVSPDDGSAPYSLSFLVGSAGADTCSGDSGGPLFTEEVGGPLLRGITSSGGHCGSGGSYTNVGLFAPWLGQFLARPTGRRDFGKFALAFRHRGVAINTVARPSTANGTDFGNRLRAGRTKNRSFTLSTREGSVPLSILKATVSGRGFRLLSVPPRYLFSGVPRSITVQFRAPRTKRKSTRIGWIDVVTENTSDPFYIWTFPYQLRARSIPR